jgi:hypothetical protein
MRIKAKLRKPSYKGGSITKYLNKIIPNGTTRPDRIPKIDFKICVNIGSALNRCLMMW